MDQLNLKTLASDPTNRMKRPPPSQRPNSGHVPGMRENLGSDFSAERRGTKGGRKKTLQDTPVGFDRKTGTIELTDSDDDELPAIGSQKSKYKGKERDWGVNPEKIAEKSKTLKGMGRIPKKSSGNSSSQSKPGSSTTASGSRSQSKAPDARDQRKFSPPRTKRSSPPPKSRVTRDSTREEAIDLTSDTPAKPKAHPRPLGKKQEKSEVKSFPMSGPSSPSGSRISPPPKPVAQPAPFPMSGDSPVGKVATNGASSFPIPSPLKNGRSRSSSTEPAVVKKVPKLSSKASQSSGTSKKPKTASAATKARQILSEDEGGEDEEEEPPRRGAFKAQAFPMSTQMLSGIGELSQFSPGQGPQLYDDDDDGPKGSKRPRLSAGYLLVTFIFDVSVSDFVF